MFTRGYSCHQRGWFQSHKDADDLGMIKMAVNPTKKEPLIGIGFIGIDH